MDLNIFKKNEPSEIEHYWALVIGQNWVQSAIWRIVGDKAEVVAEGSSVAWSEDSEEALVIAADSTLSSAASGISEDVKEPNKVVFGLPPSWIKDGNIISERLNFLKKVSNELELSPSGFVILPEAIAHYLKSIEGSPLNAILVGPSESSIDVTLVQNGKILGSVEVAKSISIGEDVIEGLTRIGGISQYPSRILLYNHKQGNLEDAKQQLLDTDWKQAKITFIHTPKVDVLKDDIGISAVSLAGGAEVAEATGVIMPDVGEETASEGGEKILGDENLPDASDIEEVSPEELGFLEGVDVSEVNEIRGVNPVPNSSPRTAIAGDELFEPVVPISPKKGGLLAMFLGLFKMPKFEKFSTPKSSGMKFGNVAGISVIVFLALVILGGFAYWYLPTARVIVSFKPNVLEKTMTIKVDTAATSVDIQNHIIPAQAKMVDMSGDKTAQASGTKTIGEAAKGTVIILHSGPATTLKAGVVLNGPNKLKFTLDKDVAIASGSSTLLNNSPSKTQALVTASGLGPDYNLSSGSSFTIGNYSEGDFAAKNEQAFSGGTSRTVTAVSDEDRINLRKSLISELNLNGLEKIKEELGEDEILVDDSASFEISTESFNAKSGDEASTLKLSLSGRVKAIIVPKSAMNELVKAEIQQEVPAGYSLQENQLTIAYKAIPNKVTTKSEKSKKDITTNTTTSNFEATIKANLLPQVSPEEIASKIAGKNPDVAENYLYSLPGHSRSDVYFYPFKFPGIFAILPRISKNISVEVKSER